MMAAIVTLKTKLLQAIETLPQEIQALIGQVSTEQLADMALQYGMPAILIAFLGRTVAVLIMRKIGIYHPAHYRFYPRLPWRGLFQIWTGLSMWFERTFRQGKQSTSGFTSVLNVFCLLYHPKLFFVGRAYGWGIGLLQPIGLPISRHIMIMAMSGAGKTTFLISALSMWKGSASIIDPKSQITDMLERNDPRDWVVFRPYSPNNTAFLNVFDSVKQMAVLEGVGSEVKWCTRIGEALIVTPDGVKQKYFLDSARAFLVSLILHVLTFHDERDHHMGFVYELIVHGYRVMDDDGNLDSTPEESKELLIKLMMENEHFGQAIPNGASIFASASGETMGNLQSTLLEQVKWLGLPSVSYMLTKTTRKMSDLKTCDNVIFSFCAPVLSIKEELAPLVRLFTNMQAYIFEAVKEKKGQCLQVVDELPAQGFNSTIQMTLPVARSYGITFCGICQDLEGLKQAYPKSYMSFIGNSDATLWLGSAHPSNLEYLSKALGSKSFVTRDPRTKQKSYRQVPVREAEQLGRLINPDSGRMIITRAGARPILAMNDPYYHCLPVTHYDADPDHGDSFWRGITRFFLNRKPKRDRA